MPAHFVVIDFLLMLVGFLLKADAHVGSGCVKLAERQLDDILCAIDDDEQQPQTLHLLYRVCGLVSLVFCREIVPAVFAHKDKRPQGQCLEPPHREMLRVDFLHIFLFYAVLTRSISSSPRNTCPISTSFLDVGHIAIDPWLA